MTVTNRWYLKHGRLHCRKCGLPSADRSRGQQHSHCWVEPSPGIGYPLPTDPPLRLVTGFTSTLNGQMTRYLSQPSERRAFDDLERRHPGWAEVFWSHLRGGETLAEIAQRLGISTSAAWQRNSRARRFVADRVRIYEDELDERRTDGPPTLTEALSLMEMVPDAS